MDFSTRFFSTCRAGIGLFLLALTHYLLSTSTDISLAIGPLAVALGANVLGAGIGYLRGRSRRKRAEALADSIRRAAVAGQLDQRQRILDSQEEQADDLLARASSAGVASGAGQAALLDRLVRKNQDALATVDANIADVIQAAGQKAEQTKFAGKEAAAEATDKAIGSLLNAGTNIAMGSLGGGGANPLAQAAKTAGSQTQSIADFSAGAIPIDGLAEVELAEDPLLKALKGLN